MILVIDCGRGLVWIYRVWPCLLKRIFGYTLDVDCVFCRSRFGCCGCLIVCGLAVSPRLCDSAVVCLWLCRRGFCVGVRALLFRVAYFSGVVLRCL